MVEIADSAPAAGMGGLIMCLKTHQMRNVEAQFVGSVWRLDASGVWARSRLLEVGRCADGIVTWLAEVEAKGTLKAMRCSPTGIAGDSMHYPSLEQKCTDQYLVARYFLGLGSKACSQSRARLTQPALILPISGNFPRCCWNLEVVLQITTGVPLLSSSCPHVSSKRCISRYL